MTDTKPKRRWFRFSLSSLLLFVTAICIWLAWQAHRVHERTAMIEQVLARHGMVDNAAPSIINGADYHVGMGQHPERIPKILLLMGAKPIHRIFVQIGEFSADERRKIKAVFPELDDDCLGLPEHEKAVDASPDGEVPATSALPNTPR